MNGNSSVERYEMETTNDPENEYSNFKFYHDVPKSKYFSKKSITVPLIVIAILLITGGLIFLTTQVNRKEQRLSDQISKLSDEVDELDQKGETNKDELGNQITEIKQELDSIRNDIRNNTHQQIKISSNLNETIRGVIQQKESINASLTTLKKDSEAKLSQVNQRIKKLQNTVNAVKKIIIERENLTAEETDEMFYDDGTGNETKHIIARKQKLLSYLEGISGSKTLSGVYVTYTGINRNKGIESILNITEKNPAIISTTMPRYLAEVSEWTPFTDEIISNWNNGHLVRINWWEGPLLHLPGLSSTSNSASNDIRWRGLIQDGGDLNLAWKAQLDLIVPHLRKLENAGVVTIFEIFHWINWKGYIWRERPGINGSAKFYQITHDYLTNHHNLHSLLWTFPLDSDAMPGFEDYWPGSEYVDVVSVDMSERSILPIGEYQRLVTLVGNKPMSLERIETIPSLSLLAAQPRWTWFTAIDTYIMSSANNKQTVKSTFSSTSVINKGSIDFFGDTN